MSSTAQHALTPVSTSSVSPVTLTPARQLYIPSTEPEYLPGSKLLLCSCAKCGSTSLYEWLYEAVIGTPWVPDPRIPSSDVQNLFSSRWEGKWSHDAPTTRSSYYAAAFVREPVSRLLSAYKDKLACGLLIPRDPDSSSTFSGLRLTASAEVRRRYAEGLFRLEDRGRKLTTEPSMCWTGNAWEACQEDGCVSLDAFAETLANIHADNNARSLDAHFRPQNLVCFGDGNGLATWDSVTAIDDAPAIARLSAWLNTSLPFPSAHSTKGVELQVSAAAHRNLKKATHKEREMLAPYLRLSVMGDEMFYP